MLRSLFSRKNPVVSDYAVISHTSWEYLRDLKGNVLTYPTREAAQQAADANQIGWSNLQPIDHTSGLKFV